MTRSSLLWLLLVAGLLVLVVGLLPAQAPREKQASWRSVALPSADNRPLTDYSAIWRRPLFSPGRKQEAQPPRSPGQALRPLSDYRLVGVVVANDAKFALIERNDSNQVVTLHVGDDLDGRRVDDIRVGGIVLGDSEFLAMPRPQRRLRRGRF